MREDALVRLPMIRFLSLLFTVLLVALFPTPGRGEAVAGETRSGESVRGPGKDGACRSPGGLRYMGIATIWRTRSSRGNRSRSTEKPARPRPQHRPLQRGACSWNEIDARKMVKSKIIFRYRQMEGFWLDGKNPIRSPPSWDWSVDAKQRAMLAKAKQRGVNEFELFSNSPMWWMTKNDNPSGGPKPNDDNLAPGHERNFAIYLATVARRAADHWGVSFTTVSPFNEPRSDWWSADCKQEGCHVSAPAQARILKLVREELDRRDLERLPISASEETHYDHAIETWESFDKATRALIGQVNVHGYQEASGDREKLHRLVHVGRWQAVVELRVWRW